MSLNDSTLSSQGQEIAGPERHITTLQLNDLFKESMQRAQAVCVRKTVTRCEPLPVVRGQRDELARLFDALTSTIFGSRPTGSKYFLYVDCEAGGPVANDGFGPVQIRFHTNITSDAAWMEANKGTLNGCRRILELHEATLSVNEVKHTGCLFAITIPGKFQ